jgi:hypothetical protein
MTFMAIFDENRITNCILVSSRVEERGNAKFIDALPTTSRVSFNNFQQQHPL